MKTLTYGNIIGDIFDEDEIVDEISKGGPGSGRYPAGSGKNPGGGGEASGSGERKFLDPKDVAKDFKKEFKEGVLDVRIGRSPTFGTRVDVTMEPDKYKVNQEKIATFAEEHDYTLKNVMLDDITQVKGVTIEHATTFTLLMNVGEGIDWSAVLPKKTEN